MTIEICNDRFSRFWPNQAFTDRADAEKRLRKVFTDGSFYALQCENITVKWDNGTWMSRGDVVLIHVLAGKRLAGWNHPPVVGP